MSRVTQLEKQITELQNELSQARANQFFPCSQCGSRTKLNKTMLIEKYWYEQPYGCSGGACWNFGEYVVPCFKCNKSTRIYESKFSKDDNKVLKFIRKNYIYFGERLKWYPSEREQYKPIDIDELRKIQKK